MAIDRTPNDETDGDEWRSVVPITPSTPNLVEFGEEEIEETSADRVVAMLDAVSGDDRAYVKVSRVLGHNNFQWCQDYPTAEYEAGGLKMIRDTWGPGKYDCRLYGTNPGSKRFTILAKSQIEIAMPVNAAPSAPGYQAQGFEAVLRTMQEQNNRVMEILSKQQQSDPMEAFAKQMALMGQFKDVFGGGGPQQSISDIMKAIREMKDISEELNPKKEESDSDNPMSMIPGILNLVQTAMSQRQQEQPMHAIALPAMIAQAPVAMPPSVAVPLMPEALPVIPETEDPMNLFQIVKLKALVSTIMAMAVKKAPVDQAAELLLTELPEEMLDAMEQDNWFETLSQGMALLGADIAPHKEWLTLVRTDMLREDPEESSPVA